MVDALRRIHRSLRPDGVLVDIHPQPENSAVEVWRGDRVAQLGHIEEDVSDVTEARARLDRLEGEGWFSTEGRRFFDLLAHFPSVDAWLEHRAGEESGGVVSDDLIARARQMLATEHGELVVREPIRATLLKRLPAPG